MIYTSETKRWYLRIIKILNPENEMIMFHTDLQVFANGARILSATQVSALLMYR